MHDITVGLEGGQAPLAAALRDSQGTRIGVAQRADCGACGQEDGEDQAHGHVPGPEGGSPRHSWSPAWNPMLFTRVSEERWRIPTRRCLLEFAELAPFLGGLLGCGREPVRRPLDPRGAGHPRTV
ncbi:Sigma factor RpoE negative regulatory protein RseB precursor [Nocardioides sp. AX2bis]|nr:Sigma factor RpoE negative regulatory protein RseB precursor [Nocardioides sp. AX2bis]